MLSNSQVINHFLKWVATKIVITINKLLTKVITIFNSDKKYK